MDQDVDQISVTSLHEVFLHFLWRRVLQVSYGLISSKLINLPQLEDPLPHELFLKSSENYIHLSVEIYIPIIWNTLTDHISSSGSNSGSSWVFALVLDMFLYAPMVLDLAEQLGLPTYLLLSTNVWFLCFMLYLPIIHDQIGRVQQLSRLYRFPKLSRGLREFWWILSRN